MQAKEAVLAHHFENLEQQHEAGTLGMWMFLATEVMFFGALFTGYTVYRSQFPAEFTAASKHLNTYLAAFNTAVLICSSLTMAMAVYAARVGKQGLLAGSMIATIGLGAAFLGFKAYEWRSEFHEELVPGYNFNNDNPAWTGGHAEEGSAGHVAVNPKHVQMFFVFYFIMTGLHATHMVMGLSVMGFLLARARQGRYGPQFYTPIEMVGLYWHFVDIVWIFLFPLIYLVRH